ncbi:hypothetical protein Q1M63_00610 (plasmid) [Sinorhizobium meliloti]|nr:hypothetical protein Q1M63_00610 [Sinorhizobium meliloti]
MTTDRCDYRILRPTVLVQRDGEVVAIGSIGFPLALQRLGRRLSGGAFVVAGPSLLHPGNGLYDLDRIDQIKRRLYVALLINSSREKTPATKVGRAIEGIACLSEGGFLGRMKGIAAAPVKVCMQEAL